MEIFLLAAVLWALGAPTWFVVVLAVLLWVVTFEETRWVTLPKCIRCHREMQVEAKSWFVRALLYARLVEAYCTTCQETREGIDRI